jgi:tRNA(fMet)-specific endonuclease VapC
VKILLDTNAYSELARGHPVVADLVRGAEAVVFSTIVVGELLAGFRRGTHRQQNVADLRRFVSQPSVTLLPVTWTTADRFGLVHAALRRKGRPIPTNDIWVAAHALETGADLISFDPHFGHVEGLAWIAPGTL